MTIEDLLQETGGFGRFQVIILVFLFSNKLSVGWSMLQMSFAGLIPDWSCMLANETSPQNGSLKACTVNSTTMDGSDVSCDRYEFQGSELTIINQWDLVCDMKWVKATVTSIQMAGVLVGALVAGQCGDYFGRKKTNYLFALEHCVVNIIAAFSVNWEMFAACRFFIGVGIGGILVIVFPYPMEFLPTKWRPILAVLPVWALGVCFFAVSALLLKDWSHVHIACGVLAMPSLLGYFWVPESLRWLTVFGHIKEAEKVVTKIAITNNKPIPAKTVAILQQVAEDEKLARENGQKYSYIDVFRGWYTAKITLTFCFLWFSFSLVYYGISFGVSSLAGNIYLNIFLLAVVELPPQFSTFYFNNKIGRKKTAFILITAACIASFACLAVHELGPESSKDQIITGLSLTAKMGIGAGWSVLQTWGAELYPTVTRNLGYGAANTAARVGGIIAPFAINFDDIAVVSYIIMGVLLLIDGILVLITPETKGKVLADSLVAVTVIKADENGAVKGDNTDIFMKGDKNGVAGVGEEMIVIVKENTPRSCNADEDRNGTVVKDSNAKNHPSSLKGVEMETPKRHGSLTNDESKIETPSVQSGIESVESGESYLSCVAKRQGNEDKNQVGADQKEGEENKEQGDKDQTQGDENQKSCDENQKICDENQKEDDEGQREGDENQKKGD